MLKRRIFALTLMACVVFAGVVYGGWTKRQEVNLSTKSGTLCFGIGDADNVSVVINCGEKNYRVEPQELTLLEGQSEKELVISVEKSKLDEAFTGDSRITGISVEYEIVPTENNTVSEVMLQENILEHNAVFLCESIKKLASDETASGGELNNTAVSRECSCESTTKSERIRNDSKQCIKVEHITKFADIFEYNSGDVGTFSYDDIVIQVVEGNTDKYCKLSMTYGLWSQKIVLNCRIVII